MKVRLYMAKKVTSGKPTIPSNETKEQKFMRVVTPRIKKAVRAIRVIGNCFSTGYIYTPEQAAKILNTLAGELTVLESLTQRKALEKQEFEW
jgi:hypothetical protein